MKAFSACIIITFEFLVVETMAIERSGEAGSTMCRRKGYSCYTQLDVEECKEYKIIFVGQRIQISTVLPTNP